MALGEASVRILPDVSDFEKQLLSAVSSAMSAAQGAVDDAAAGISGAFDGAASEANAALASVTGDDFSGAVGAADAAAGEVAGAMDGAASEADAALSSVDGDGFTAASQAADQASTQIGQSFEEASSTASRALGSIDLSNLTKGVGSFAAVTVAVRGFINEAEQGQKAEARIRQIATSMDLFGANVDGVVTRLEAYANATARATGVDDDSIMAAQAKLLTFRELARSADVVGGSFDRATQAAIDLAAAGFGSAESNAVQLGKALQDPIKGITALARAGVTFTATEKERIRTLVESNQIGEAQRMVLAAIEQQVGGTGVATATASEKMRVGFSQAQEELGNALVPAMSMLADVTSTVLGVFNSLPEPVRNVITVVGVAGTAFYAASRTLQGLGLAAGTANKALGAIGLVLGAGIAIYSVYTRGKRQAEKATQDFKAALDAEAGGQEDATEALLARIIADSDALKIREQLGVSELAIASAIRGNSVPALTEMSAKLKEVDRQHKGNYATQDRIIRDIYGVGRLELAAFVEEIDKQRNALEAAETAAANQADTLGAMATTGNDAAAAQSRLLGLTRQSENAFGDAAVTGDDLAQAMLEQEQAALDAESALRGLINATLASFNSQLGLEDATFRTNDAIAAYLEVGKQAEAGTIKGLEALRMATETQNDAAAASLSQAAAAAQLAEDQALASGATFTAADSARVQRDELRRVADSLDPNSPLRKQLEGYIDQLNNKIPKDVATKITASLRVVPMDIETRRALRLQTAEGGVFSSAQTRVIGEAGAEAVIPITKPARAVELLEMSGLADLVRSSSGGAMVNIQQATFASATDADLVAQRLNTALRVRSFGG